MFEVEYDPPARRMRIGVKGFWQPGDVAAFAKAIGGAATEVRAIDDDFDVLIESLDFPVQSNEVADLMTSVMRGGVALTRGHVAIVVASLLNKLQAERTLEHPRVKIFMAMDEAEAWLAATRA